MSKYPVTIILVLQVFTARCICNCKIACSLAGSISPRHLPSEIHMPEQIACPPQIWATRPLGCGVTCYLCSGTSESSRNCSRSHSAIPPWSSNSAWLQSPCALPVKASCCFPLRPSPSVDWPLLLPLPNTFLFFISSLPPCALSHHFSVACATLCIVSCSFLERDRHLAFALILTPATARGNPHEIHLASFT